MPSIPQGFQPIVSGYSYGGPGGAMATQVAGGAARYGLDYDGGTQRFSVTLLIVSALQMSVWTAFYYQVIKQGTISFDMPLDSGFGLSPHSCNIVPQTYQVSGFVGGGICSVNFTVEAESQAYSLEESSAETLLYLYASYGETSDSLLARIAQFANTDINVLSF